MRFSREWFAAARRLGRSRRRALQTDFCPGRRRDDRRMDPIFQGLPISPVFGFSSRR
jgi:hypothetical protein